MMKTLDRIFGVVLRGSLVAAAAWTAPALEVSSARAADDRGFRVEFTDCVESIGVGLAPTEEVRALMPAALTPVGEGGPETPIVVRTARCGGISVNGGRSRAGTIVQVGAVIVPPDSSGDINNYTLWYYTSDFELAIHLAARGVPAQYVPTLDFRYEQAGPGKTAPLHVVAPWPALPAMRIDGVAMASDASAGSFLANWWVQAGRRLVKMETEVPDIHIGSADLTLKTRPREPLGRLIGGNTLDFLVLQQFNTFAVARMDVTISSP